MGPRLQSKPIMWIYIECNYVKFCTNYIRGQKSDSPHDIIISREELFSICGCGLTS